MFDYPGLDMIPLDIQALLQEEAKIHALLSCPLDEIQKVVTNIEGWGDAVDSTEAWLSVYAVAVSVHLGRNLPSVWPGVWPWSPEAREAELQWQRDLIQKYQPREIPMMEPPYRILTPFEKEKKP